MNNYKDFIIKTLIITFAVLIVIFFLLSPINKVLRVADSLLMKIDILMNNCYGYFLVLPKA